MREFEQKYSCTASEISQKIPVLQDRKHIKGNLNPLGVFEVKSFQSRILGALKQNEQEYLRSMLDRVDGNFDSVTAIRIAFNEGREIFQSGDPSTKDDIIILRKIFGFQSSIPLGSRK